VDAVAALEREAPDGIEVKRLCGQIVWLREGPQEWTGPAEEALALLRAVDPALGFWTAFSPAAA